MLVTTLSFFLIIQILFLFTKKKSRNAKLFNDFFSFLVFILLMFMFFFKNEDFGADTKNYITEFSYYCIDPQTYFGVDYTYKVVFFVLDSIMLNSCNVYWLMWIWPLLIIVVLYAAAHIFKFDKIYLVAFITSFIGIELLTNAMRQGFSIAILILAFCFYLKKRYLWFAVFAAVSFLFHQASMVIIAILIISRLNYKIVIPCFAIGIFVSFTTVYFDVLPGVLSFKNAIYKYLPYADEDFIVRLISIASLFLTVIIYKWATYKNQLEDKKINNSLLNIVFICSLVSFVPYLGFRVIYGIYPLVLLMLSYTNKRNGNFAYEYLSYVSCINSIITIVWLCGSTHMRIIPFVSII